MFILVSLLISDKKHDLILNSTGTKDVIIKIF